MEVHCSSNNHNVSFHSNFQLFIERSATVLQNLSITSLFPLYIINDVSSNADNAWEKSSSRSGLGDLAIPRSSCVSSRFPFPTGKSNQPVIAFVVRSAHHARPVHCLRRLSAARNRPGSTMENFEVSPHQENNTGASAINVLGRDAKHLKPYRLFRLQRPVWSLPSRHKYREHRMDLNVSSMDHGSVQYYYH